MRSAGDPGFDRERPADRHVTLWQLEAVRELCATRTSRLYQAIRQGEPVVLKLFRRGSDEENSGAALRYFDGCGAVRLLAADGDALLLERLEQPDRLRSMSLGGQDGEASTIIAGVIGALHNAVRKPVPPRIETVEQRWQPLLRFKARQIPDVLARGAALARRLLADPRDVRLLHGDIHHENILLAARGWVAIDPKGVVGERTYEVANAMCNPFGAGSPAADFGLMRRRAEIYADALALDRRRILAILNGPRLPFRMLVDRGWRG